MLKKLVIMFMLCLLTACAPLQALARSSSERQMDSAVELMSPLTEGAWSGVVVDQSLGTYGYPTTVLTIIHDSPETRLFVAMGAFPIMGKVGLEGTLHSYRVAKWDPCSEVALITTVLENPVEVSYLAWWKSQPGDKVSTVGNPLGQGLQFNKGYVSAKETLAYECTFADKPVVLDSYAGGTVPGQTGSALFNSNGRITGLLTAVALYPAPVFLPMGIPIGFANTLVPHMGYFIPLNIIKQFLKSSPYL